jgi:septal ring factor EnvC (AmiA/AmiB activator)
MYNIENLKDRKQYLIDAADYDGPTDAVCDAIPSVITYIEKLEEMIVKYKKTNQKLDADLKDALRRNNNLNSQKVRHLKKKGKY